MILGILGFAAATVYAADTIYSLYMPGFMGIIELIFRAVMITLLSTLGWRSIKWHRKEPIEVTEGEAIKTN